MKRLATVVPGLLMTRDGLTVVHEATGTTILNLPAGLGLETIGGAGRTTFRLSHNASAHVTVVHLLAKLDWRLPLSAEHVEAALVLQQALPDLQAVQHRLERQARIHAGLEIGFRFARAKAHVIHQARLARHRLERMAVPTTSAGKAAVTRQRKAFEQALNEAGLTVLQLDCLERASLGRQCVSLKWYEGHQRIEQQAMTLYFERSNRISQAQANASKFLRQDTGFIRELSACALMIGGAAPLPELSRAALKAAALERQRRLRAGESFDLAAPEVRALTRKARCIAATYHLSRSRHPAYLHGQSAVDLGRRACRRETSAARRGGYRALQNSLKKVLSPAQTDAVMRYVFACLSDQMSGVFQAAEWPKPLVSRNRPRKYVDHAQGPLFNPPPLEVSAACFG